MRPVPKRSKRADERSPSGSAGALREELYVETIAPKIHPVRVEEDYGRFVIEPLERGFGTTIGNSLRRVLLSSIPGVAITTVKIDGVQHEFSTIPGVVEDATEIILNLKHLAIKLHTNGQELTEPLVMRVDREGEGEITAADIETPPELEIVNRGEHIATLAKDGRLRMELTVARGKGYVPAGQHANQQEVIGEIVVSSVFTPVPKVHYTVEPTRVGHRTDLDRLTLDLWTNGTVHPSDALAEAARILDGYFRLFFEMGEEPEVAGAGAPAAGAGRAARTRAVNTRIEDLDFSVRTSNCLRNQGIETLGDLLEKSEADLLATRHFGKKSLTEVKEKLAQYDLHLANAKETGEEAETAEETVVDLEDIDVETSAEEE